MLFKGLSKYNEGFHFVFRVLVGLLFFQHGGQKLFGWFTDKGAVELVSLMGLAGTIELVGGILLVLGLFTRLTALISGVEMIVAYGMAHASRGLIPIANGGELALLYLACFIAIFGFGAGKLSLDAKWFKS